VINGQAFVDQQIINTGIVDQNIGQPTPVFTFFIFIRSQNYFFV